MATSTKTPRYSLCIPSTCISHCVNLEQITHTVYQIAKTATLFNLQEIVVLTVPNVKESNSKQLLADDMLVATLLQYFITPPYLRKTVFKAKYSKYFQIADKLPRLSALPYMRHNDTSKYREGLSVTMENPTLNKNKKNKVYKQTKYINVGQSKYLELKGQLVPTNVRVTVNTETNKIVSPVEAYGDENIGMQSSYGYHVRVANQFSALYNTEDTATQYSQSILVDCEGYYNNRESKDNIKLSSIESIRGENILLVCSGLKHLKAAFNAEKDQFEGVDSVKMFFDGQLAMPSAMIAGNVTVEDAAMIAMATLQAKIN